MKHARPLVTAAMVWLILLATAPVAASTFTPSEVSPVGGIGGTAFSRTTPTGGPPTQIAVLDVPSGSGIEVAAAPPIG